MSDGGGKRSPTPRRPPRRRRRARRPARPVAFDGAPAPMAPLMRPQQMAAHLGISPAHLKRLVRAGKVPVIRIGPRTPRFDPIAVRRALTKNDGGARDRCTRYEVSS